MCSRVDCPKCGKPSFVGCGRHVEQVLGDVPKEKRCKCNEATTAASSSAPAARQAGGLLSWLTAGK